MINGQRVLTFALDDPEVIKEIPHFQKKQFFFKNPKLFFQNIKIDGILTLIAVEIDGTFDGTP